jgi:hypothetical protein
MNSTGKALTGLRTTTVGSNRGTTKNPTMSTMSNNHHHHHRTKGQLSENLIREQQRKHNIQTNRHLRFGGTIRIKRSNCNSNSNSREHHRVAVQSTTITRMIVEEQLTLTIIKRSLLHRPTSSAPLLETPTRVHNSCCSSTIYHNNC